MTEQEANLALAEDMGCFSVDPYAWVMYSFEWGKGELEAYKGPEPWQIKELKYLRDLLKAGVAWQEVIRIAICSGNGIGKSALIAWIVLWGLSTFPDAIAVITAGTERQLKGKTWPVLSTWYRRCIISKWFNLTATSLLTNEKQHQFTWRADLVPWSKTNPEAFAGLHNQKRRIIFIMDEASQIPKEIWEVAEGAMTDKDTQIFWIVCGNGTRREGRFFDCFNRLRNRWHQVQIDSRTVGITNKELFEQWIADYGIDSDFVRVHILGLFPESSEMQFIPTHLVTAAFGKSLQPRQYDFAPVILGLDPAWWGEDELAIAKRQGLASSILWTEPKNDDDMAVARKLALYEDEFNADAVFIDMAYGTGIYSAGKSMNRKWTLVSFAEKTVEKYLNKRAEMWDGARDWLRKGGALPADPVLAEDLKAPEDHPRTDGKIQLEGKEEMRKRGIRSPNRADALALTFAYPVRSKGLSLSGPEFAYGHKGQREYDPFGVLKK